jgi:hypothetical protein
MIATTWPALRRPFAFLPHGSSAPALCIAAKSPLKGKNSCPISVVTADIREDPNYFRGEKARESQELAQMSDRELQDIGLTRLDAEAFSRGLY